MCNMLTLNLLQHTKSSENDERAVTIMNHDVTVQKRKNADHIACR